MCIRDSLQTVNPIGDAAGSGALVKRLDIRAVAVNGGDIRFRKMRREKERMGSNSAAYIENSHGL